MKAKGLDAMEVQFGRQVRMAEDKALALKARAEELGVRLSAHAPYYINLNSSDPSKLEKSKEWLLKAARATDLFGGRVVVVHAASYMGSDSAATTAAVVENLGPCRDILAQEGVGIVLGLETMGRGATWGTLKEISEVMKAVSGVVPVLDFAHVHARYGGVLRTKADFRALLQECYSFYSGPLHCHFSCIEFTDKGEKRHLRLEAKQPDYAQLAELIKGTDRDMTLIAETPDPVDGAIEMRNMLLAR